MDSGRPQSSTNHTFKKSKAGPDSTTTQAELVTYKTTRCSSSIQVSLSNNQMVNVLLDTGAEVNVVSKDYADKYGKDRSDWTGSIAPLGGRAVKSYGIINLEFLINDKIESLPFVIVETIGKYNIIFGEPALQKLGVSIDYKSQKAKLNNIIFDLSPRLEKLFYPLRAAKDYTVNPRIQKHLNIKIANNFNGLKHTNFLVSPSKVLLNNSPLRMPNGYYKGDINKFNKIILANTASIPITVKKGALLGYITSIPFEINTVAVDQNTYDIIQDEDAIDFPVEEKDLTIDEFLEKLQNQINPELRYEEKNLVTIILKKFKTIFAPNPRAPGVTTKTKCHIPLKEGTVPIRLPAYRASPRALMEMKNQIKILLDGGIIRKGTSAWSFPVVLAPKPDGSWRFCVDYSKLSDHVVRDTYPLPRIDDTLDKLAKAKVFSTMDAASGYWQVPIVENDQEILAFTTPFGSYLWNRMPMGYINSSSVFQRAMNETLDEHLFFCCLVYIDDIIVYSPTLEQHLIDLEKVLTSLQAFGWQLKLAKCKFCFTELDFLGHTISQGKVQVAKKNIDKLKNAKRPCNVKELQSFLGLTNYYRRFIKDYTTVVSPLFNLLRKDAEFKWDNNCEKAYLQIVELLNQYPILKLPDFEKTFIIRTDASDFGLGMTLAQVHDGIEHPVCYNSIKLIPAQRKWPTWKKEGCAVVMAIKHWHHYVAHAPFIVITDHEALTRILDPEKTCKPIIDRWRIFLSQFKFKIIHRPGKDMVLEDMMSRSPEFFAIKVDDLASSQKNDPIIKEIKSIINDKQILPSSEEIEKILKANHHNLIVDDDILYFYDPLKRKDKRVKRMVLGKEMIIPILAQFHDHPLSGHLGTDKTYEKLAKLYWFPDMYKTVKNYCNKCKICDQNRIFFQKNSNTIPIISSSPMEIIEIDHVGPFTKIKRDGKEIQYVLSVVDHFTKKRWFFPAESTSAEETYLILTKNIFCNFDFPKSILTDRGSAFDNELSQWISSLTGIDHRYAIPNQHTTVGAVERSNRILEDMLRKYINSIDQNNWDQYLHLLAYAINKAESKTHGYAPDLLMFGREPITPLKIDKNNNGTNFKNIKENHFKNFTKYWDKANIALKDYRKKMAKESDKAKLGKRSPDDFNVKDSVWLHNSVDNSAKGISFKLTQRGLGPYKIVKILPNNNLQLQITPTKTICVHRDQVRKSKSEVCKNENEKFKLIPNIKETIVINNPPPPPKLHEEKRSKSKEGLDVNTIVGRRIEIQWPNKKWYRGTVVGYTNSKAKNLIFYDEPTIDVTSREEDFYAEPLFKNEKYRGKIYEWYLLESFKK